MRRILKFILPATPRQMVGALLVVICLLVTWLLVPNKATSQVNEIMPWSEPSQFPMSGWFPDIATDPSGRIHVVWSQSIYVADNQVQKATAMPISEFPEPTASVMPTTTLTIEPTPTATITATATLTITSAAVFSETNIITPTPAPTPSTGFDVVFYTSSTDGEHWSPVNDIIALPQAPVGNVEVTRPNLLIDPAGTMHMTFRDIFIHYSQAPLSEPELATNWRAPYLISQDNLAYFSQMVLGRDGRLHMVYTENVQSPECNICYHIFYRYSDDNGRNWSHRSDISVLPTGAAKPTLLLDEEDNLHLVWESGPGGTLGGVVDPVQILYSVSRDGGQTWSTPLAFTNPEETYARNIALVRTRYNWLLVAWLNLTDDRIYYILSLDHGLTWTVPEPIPGVLGEQGIRNTRQNNFAAVTDNTGIVHLVLTGRINVESQSMSLLHLTWDSMTWSEPIEIITYTNGDAPEWPRMAIQNGNVLHLLWFVRPRDHIWDANPNYYSIWHASRLIDAIPYEPQEMPAPTPIPSPTAIPTQVLDTPTPLPDFGEDPLGKTSVMIFNENDELLVIFGSLLPAIMLLGAIMLVMRLRRR